MNFFFLKQILFILYHVEKKKKGTYSLFETELIFHPEELFRPCCYTGGGQLLFELQAKGDKGDPCNRGVLRGWGAVGVQAKSNGFLTCELAIQSIRS